MDQPATDATQALMDDTAETAVILHADVLEHADGDECIVLARDIAIIVLHEFNRRAEALAFRSFARKSDLFMRNIECPHLDAVFLRHVDCEASPPAACLNNTFTCLQPQLPADM